MERLRHRRKYVVAGLVALGTLIGLVTFVVLPAFAAASAPGAQVPPASIPQNITPIDVSTGGQSNDCTLFYTQTANTNTNTTKPQPAYQFRIANPKKGQFSYSDPATGAIFAVTVDSTDKWASFSASGAKVVDVGIKGGTDETWYNYDQAALVFPTGPASGYVTADGGPVATTPGTLHAPAQDTSSNPVSLYGISNLTFCYNIGSVSGTVYLDANQNGVKDGTDTGQSGWTVRLYGTGSTPLATRTSDANGFYSFNGLIGANTNYRICEAPPSGTWGQTQPSPSSPNRCSGTGELKKGYSFTASTVQDITGDDFGNAPAVPCSQPMGLNDGQGTSYSVQLNTCKMNNYMFNSGVLPSGGLFVSVWATDQSSGNKVADVEKITFPFSKVSGAYRQNPFSRQTAATATPSWDDLRYSDVFPGSSLKPMLICNLDPRSSEFGLQTTPVDYTNLANAGLVIPNYNADPTQGETSCLIQETQMAGGKYVAYVYSSLDAVRGSAP